MKSYKCFILDADFHIGERLFIEADSDERAIAIAAGLLDRRPDMATCELWDGARLVQRLARAEQ